MDPGPIFSIDKQPHQLCLLSAIPFFILLQTLSFHTIQLILCFQRTGENYTLTESLGQSILVVLCAGSALLATSTASNNFLASLLLVSQQHLQKRLSSPTGSIKPWFLTEGKLTVVLIIPSSWGSQRIAICEHQKP